MSDKPKTSAPEQTTVTEEMTDAGARVLMYAVEGLPDDWAMVARALISYLPDVYREMEAARCRATN